MNCSVDRGGSWFCLGLASSPPRNAGRNYTVSSDALNKPLNGRRCRAAADVRYWMSVGEWLPSVSRDDVRADGHADVDDQRLPSPSVRATHARVACLPRRRPDRAGRNRQKVEEDDNCYGGGGDGRGRTRRVKRRTAINGRAPTVGTRHAANEEPATTTTTTSSSSSSGSERP